MSCIPISKCLFPEGFFPGFSWRDFLFHHCTQWAPKYHLAESKTTVLANCSKKGRVELCVRKSHLRKQSLRNPLSSFYLRIFPLTQEASLRKEISHCRFQENCVSKLITEEKHVTLWVAFIHRSAFSQKASFQVLSEDISFFTEALKELPNITLQNPGQEC